MKIHDATMSNTNLNRLITRLDIAIEQQAILKASADKPGHQPLVVQHISVHQNDVTNTA